MQRGRIIESEIIKSDGEGYRERGEVYKQRERATREERGWSDAEDSREAHGEIMLVESGNNGAFPYTYWPRLGLPQRGTDMHFHYNRAT